MLFTIAAAGPDPSQVAVLDLKTGQRKTLIRGGSDAEYVDPSITSTGSAQTRSGQAGYLIYAAASTLRAVQTSLVWVDRKGREEPIKAPPL